MPQRQRRPRVNRHFKIDDALAPDAREAYLAYLREPRTTIDLAHAWLAEKGYADFSRSAVARHRRHCLELFLQREQAAEAATHYAALSREGGFSADGLVMGLAARFEMLLFDALVDRPGRGRKLTLKQLNELGRLVAQMVATRQQVFKLGRQIESAGQRTSASAGPTKPHTNTPEEEHAEMIRRVCDLLDYPYPGLGSEAKPSGAGVWNKLSDN